MGSHGPRAAVIRTHANIVVCALPGLIAGPAANLSSAAGPLCGTDGKKYLGKPQMPQRRRFGAGLALSTT
jgi:hypothetical protein